MTGAAQQRARKIDRRALFASGAAAALLAATGTSAQASPRRGGLLRLAIPRNGLLTQIAREAVYDQLTQLSPKGLLQGELARSWHSADAGRIWQIDLSGDAHIAGRPLGARDVVASLLAHREAGVALQDLRHVEATAPDQLQLELQAADPQLPYRLAGSELSIAADGDFAPALAPGAGSGLYQITRAQEGRDLRLERVAHHYREAQAGWLDALEVVVIPDAKVRSEALREGYVDAAVLPEPDGLRGRSRFFFRPPHEAGDAGGHVVLSAEFAAPDAPGMGFDGVIHRLAERWWRA